MTRIRNCTDRLQDLYDGRIYIIEELEEVQLDIYGGGETFCHEHRRYNNWAKTVTTNVI